MVFTNSNIIRVRAAHADCSEYTKTSQAVQDGWCVASVSPAATVVATDDEQKKVHKGHLLPPLSLSRFELHTAFIAYHLSLMGVGDIILMCVIIATANALIYANLLQLVAHLKR